MITVTEQAVEKVKGLQETQGRTGSSLRIFVQGGGCAGFKYGMAFDDQPEVNDHVYDFSGLKVLVGNDCASVLDGATVDYVESLEGAGFQITNPNVESACGCGNSFKQKEGDEEHDHEHAHAGGCGSGGCC